MTSEKQCESCRAGEIYDVPAEFIISGHPLYHYVCENHLEILLADGEIADDQARMIGVDNFTI